MKNVRISLENPHSVFFSPGSISGTVSVSIRLSGIIPGVSIRVLGSAKNKFNYTTADYKWVPQANSNNLEQRLVTRNRVARGDEVVIDQSYDLTSPLPIETPGKTEFPFRMILPHGLPCSFSSYYAKINYVLEARVAVGPKTEIEKIGIVVVSLYDLNAPSVASRVMTPVSKFNQKEFGVFESAGMLNVEYYIPKSGFVPGEVIPISGRIDNQSSKSLKCIEIRIVQRTDYRVPGVVEGELEFKTFGKVRKKGVPPFTSIAWNRTPFYVPTLPPSEMEHTNLVKIKYSLVIAVIPSGMALTLSTWIDIIIGHVPLRATTIPQQTNVLPSTPPMPSAPPDSQDPPQLIQNVKFLPVPTPDNEPLMKFAFFECGKEVCIPRYPTFMLNEENYNIEDDFEFI